MPRTTFLAAALVAAAFASGTADAGAKTVRADVYRTTVSLDISYEHKQAYGPARMVDAGLMHLEDQGPDVELVDGELPHNVALTLTRPNPKPASSAMSLDNPEGDSGFCSGQTGSRLGSYVFGKIQGSRSGIWFAPWIVARFEATCQDGGSSEFSVAPTRKADAARQSVPVDGERLYITERDLASDEFSEPFEITQRGVQCPNFETISTTSCVVTYRGHVTFTRWIRGTKEVADDVLPPATVKRGGTRVESTVDCRRRCSVELLIGVFGMRDGKPRVSPVKRVRRTAPAGPVTVKANLSAADRRDLAGGLAMAQVTVRAKGDTLLKRLTPLG